MPRAFFHQPARDGKAQTAVAARDQVRGIGTRSGGPIRTILGFGAGKRKHHFPDILAPGHVTKRVGSVLDGENIVRERLEGALPEHVHELKEQCADEGGPLAADTLQVERKIRKVIAEREKTQGLVLIDVGLTDFDEAAIGREN